MLKITTYSIFLCTIILNTLCAQDYTIREVEMNPNGKSHKYRNFMQVDHDGFLWYSTNNAVVKDFGTHNVLSSFMAENINDLAQEIYGIFFDSKRRMWVSADTGLFVSTESLDNSANRIEFKPFLMGRELQPNSFMEDCNGNLWMVASNPTDNIILKVDPSLKVTEYQIEGIEPRYTNDRYFLRNFLYFERRIGCDTFLVRQGRKFYIFDAGTTTPVADYTNSIKYSWADYIYPEWPLNGGDGLVLTDNGDIFPESIETKYIYEGEIFETYFIEDLGLQLINVPFQEMIPISQDSSPVLKNHADLIGIDGPGKTLLLFKLVEINGSFQLKKTYDIPFPFLIEDLIIDENDIIYVSSYDRIRKIKFNKNSFERFLDHSEDGKIDVRGFLELPNKEILTATDVGVFKLTLSEDTDSESSFETTKVFIKSVLGFMKSFVKVSDSTAWCVGESRGLIKINFLKNTKEEVHVFLSHPKQASLHYYDILQHSDTTLLLASHYGLHEFNTRQKQFRELPIPIVESNKELFVWDIHKTTDRLFIGTDANGLFIQNLGSNTFLNLTKDSTYNKLILPSNKVHSIFTDKQENIWLGTEKGAIHIDKDLKKLTIIDGADGLSNVNVVGILEDDHGNMWFSTHNGLYRYNKSSKKVTAFYVEDGLTSNDFNQISNYKSSRGKMLFGGIRGLVAFDSVPDTYQSQKIGIFPTKFEYYDTEEKKEIALDAINPDSRSFNLPYTKNSFSISYSINDCYNTENNKYAYRLDGFTEDWVSLGDQTTLKLLSIPPGDYVLRLKGSNSAGVESTNELNYDIHVAQIFYKRPGIQAIILFFLLGMVALALHNHSVRERKKHQLRLTMVELERKTLRAQMNPHFIFNALNGIRKTVKEGMLSKLDDYITNFSSLMRLTLDLTRNENILLSKEIRYIENYISLTNTKSEHKINLVVQYGPDIDMEDTFIPSMMLQPIVENSIVHGFTESKKKKTIRIQIEKSAATEQLVLTIEDNGIGISGAKTKSEADQGHQSYATQILHERLKLLNQIRQREFGYEIAIKDIVDETRTGAVVTIKIPY